MYGQPLRTHVLSCRPRSPKSRCHHFVLEQKIVDELNRVGCETTCVSGYVLGPNPSHNEYQTGTSGCINGSSLLLNVVPP